MSWISSIDPGGSTFPERLLQRRRARSLSCSGWFLTIVNALAQWLLPRLLGETTRIYAARAARVTRVTRVTRVARVTRAARVTRVTRVTRVARVTRAARVARPTGPAHWNGQPGRATGTASRAVPPDRPIQSTPKRLFSGARGAHRPHRPPPLRGPVQPVINPS